MMSLELIIFLIINILIILIEIVRGNYYNLTTNHQNNYYISQKIQAL